MRRVLFVLYYFPPSGGPGVQRGLKFARYLPEFGWQPVVLTVRANAAFPVRDESLLDEVPPDLTVRRTRCPEPYGAYRRLIGARDAANLDITTQSPGGNGLRQRLASWLRGSLFIPDARMGWQPFAVRAGLQLIREHGCQMLFSSGPPFTGHLIARALRRRRGLPWIADYRDPWTRATFYPPRPALARRIDRALEAACLREAERSVVVGETMAAEFRRCHPDLTPERLVVIPNGFDPADFAAVPREVPQKLRITHSGSLFHDRIPAALLTALSQLAADEPDFAAHTELCFAGRVDPAAEVRLRRPPFDRLAKLRGYLPHRASLRLLRQSSVLLLLIDTAAQAHSMVTGKIFEYLAAGAPILAIGPRKGDAARLLARTGAGWTFEHGDLAGIREHLLFLWREHRAASSAPDFGLQRQADAINRYDRREQARCLAGLCDDLAGPI